MGREEKVNRIFRKEPPHVDFLPELMEIHGGHHTSRSIDVYKRQR